LTARFCLDPLGELAALSRPIVGFILVGIVTSEEGSVVTVRNITFMPQNIVSMGLEKFAESP